MQYFSGDTITVWQIICEYSQLVDKNNSFTLYGDRLEADTMDFDGPGYGNTDLQEKYHGFFKETEQAFIVDNNGVKRKLTFAERADSTNKRMAVYLRDEFQFYDDNNTKGMKNMIAQTRLASSYGLFQVMYTTAILKAWSYPTDVEHKPEALNEVDTNFVYATERQKKLLASYENKNNWTDGYEETIRKSVLKDWNGDAYSKQAIRRLQLFLPKN
jgi:hypothetical protein